MLVSVWLIVGLILGNALALCVGLIACARLGRIQAAASGLDWEGLINLVETVAGLKRAQQKLSNRLLNMEQHPVQAMPQKAELIRMAQQQQPETIEGVIGG